MEKLWRAVSEQLAGRSVRIFQIGANILEREEN
jgi:hypothetical protein